MAARLAPGRSPDSWVVALALSALAGHALIPLGAHVFSFDHRLGMATMYLSVPVCSFLTGVVLPALCERAAQSGMVVGKAVAAVYVANIVGSVGGSLVTGLFLLDWFRPTQVTAGLALIATALLVLTRTSHGLREGRMSPDRLWVLAAGLTVAIAATTAPPKLYERLHYQEMASKKPAYKHVVENGHGIITVESDAKGDLVFGGGVYDGRFNLDPVVNSNDIVRAYMMPILKRQLGDVLVIGLSSGSWAGALLRNPATSSVTAVELNPGYLPLIRTYGTHAWLLDDPRMRVHIDDGRRWLLRNPSRRFDLILMNSLVSYRNLATNLLSVEFLEILRSHLRPNGLAVYNGTGYEASYKTASMVFRYVASTHRLVIASDDPIGLQPHERAVALRSLVKENGVAVFDPTDQKSEAVFDDLVTARFPDLAASYHERKDLWVITDDNMAPEFKEDQLPPGIRLDHRRSWGALLRAVHGSEQERSGGLQQAGPLAPH